ncbi:hypothetical protein LTR78_006337 [Recurvomyces mirabilis]|uniref:Sialidase domain-containing protein n=1 Tax=Recurvomyces mirabilis TaxID=574656 RepID=A0AAE0WLA1_9PEZI|nr:hypothetical protein LTR78_006337 [Recurvomyces mirabilis]KAK5152225.1 hypothetical protein LTS14_008601 [Recurvomyces mirabilis]
MFATTTLFTTNLLLGLAAAFPSAILHSRQDAAKAPSLSGPEISMSANGNGAYPRATILQDGSVLGVYTGSDGTNNILTLVSSTDSGSSWHEIGTAASRPTISSDLDNAYPLQLASGRILLAYRNHDRNTDSLSDYTYFRITLSYSDDNGMSWLYLSEPVSYAGSQYHGAWEPYLRLSANGTVQMYWSQENSQIDQDLLMLSSYDGGKTWANQITVAGIDIQSRDTMIGVAPASDGTLIGIFESDDTVNTNLFTVHSVTSTDDGFSWSNRQLVYTPNGTRTNAGAPQVVNVGGTLVASFMTDEDTQAQHWADDAASKLLTSEDGGATWSNKLEVFPPSSYWPATTV